MTKKGRPRDWKTRPEFMEAYEECGRSIGKSIMHDAEKEAYFWEMLGGLKLWPRWYLFAFRAMYRLENPREYAVARDRLRRRRKRKA